MKVLASDLDGTLYFGDREEKLKPEDVKAIKEFQKAGNLFGICSGRTLVGIHNALDGLDVKLDFYILVSGSSLADENGHYLYQNLLTKDIVLSIEQLLKPKNIHVMVCTNANYYVVTDKKEENEHRIVISSINDLEHTHYDSLHLAFKNLETLEEIRTLLLDELGDKIEVHHNVLNLDITPKKCSKGNAIRTFNQYYDVNYEDIYVIGDSFNDISMFDAAHTAFSFHRSDDEVKKHATHLVDNIAEAIKEICKDDEN